MVAKLTLLVCFTTLLHNVVSSDLKQKASYLRTVFRDVHIINRSSKWCYEMDIVSPNHDSEDPLPSHPFKDEALDHIDFDYSVEDGNYLIAKTMPEALPDSDGPINYWLTLATEENRIRLMRRKDYIATSIVNAPHFVKFIPANAGKPKNLPEADMLMTEPIDGQQVSSTPNGVMTDNSGECAALCHSDKECQFFTFSSEAVDQPGQVNCWLYKNVTLTRRTGNKVSGGFIQSSDDIHLINFSAALRETFYGVGGGADDQTSLGFISSHASTKESHLQAPVYHSSAGYSVFAYPYLSSGMKSPNLFSTTWAVTPMEWMQATKVPRQVTWTIHSPAGSQASVSINIFPAQNLAEHLRAYHSIIGPILPPPLHAFGLSVSQAKFHRYAQSHALLDYLRKNKIAVDSLFLQPEWHTAMSDSDLTPEGNQFFEDFSYNKNLFPNPKQMFQTYHSKYRVKIAGVRSPRLGNRLLLKVAEARGWVYANSRNLDFSNDAAVDWYSRRLDHYYSHGLDYFCNDDADIGYFTALQWNFSQIRSLRRDELDKNVEHRRFFSISNSFIPGLQKLGAIGVWTGSMDGSWQSLRQHVGYILNWSLMGAPFVSFDIGGNANHENTPELLVRWYQLGAATPFMRLPNADLGQLPRDHSESYSDAMMKAVKLHYRLIPMFYSITLAQETIIRPPIMNYPSNSPLKTTTESFLIGSQILVAPVTNMDGTMELYLPKERLGTTYWYKFDQAEPPVAGGTIIFLSDIAIDYIPIYVKEGSILVLADPTVQHTEELYDKPLEIQVYGTSKMDKDIVFQLKYDDGLNILGCGQETATITFSHHSRTLRFYTYSKQFTCTNVPKVFNVKFFFHDGTIFTKNEWQPGNSGTLNIE